MKHLKNILYFTFIMLIGCSEEISVDVAYEPQIIIFGSLNQEAGPIEITIQQSLPLDSTADFNPINTAVISLFEEATDGTITILEDNFSVSDGTYTSSSISPIIGNKYWIEVTLEDGTQYVSHREILKPVIPIDEFVLGEEDYIEIYFTDPGGEDNFYNFSVELYNFGELVSMNRSESNDVVFDGSDEALVELSIYNDYTTDDEDPDIPFNEAIVRLENINFESYQFYLNQTFQQENNASDGNGDPSPLFATPPVNIEGNISNITENKRALGNFTVRAISEENLMFVD